MRSYALHSDLYRIQSPSHLIIIGGSTKNLRHQRPEKFEKTPGLTPLEIV